MLGGLVKVAASWYAVIYKPHTRRIADTGVEHVSSPKATTSRLGIKRIEYYSAVEMQHSSEDTEERKVQKDCAYLYW